MTPQEHYEEAEKFLKHLEETSGKLAALMEDGKVTVREDVNTAQDALKLLAVKAQVHATLATCKPPSYLPFDWHPGDPMYKQTVTE